MKPETAALWQIILTGATLLVVLWYTIETRRMQQKVGQQAQELTRQVKLSIMPAFSIFTWNPNSPTGVHIINIGNGVAINIEIDRVNLNVEKLPGASISFERITVLRPQEEKGLSTECDWGREDNKPKDHIQSLLGLLAYLNNEANHLVVKFQDIEGNRYEQKIQMLYSGSKPNPVRPMSPAIK